jgi:ribosomal protein S18 acetylase RimI-like enzyme
MKTIVGTLDKIPLKTIHNTFLESFADYQVDLSYMTLDVMKKRFCKNGFEPTMSAGLFNSGHLRGFTIVGTGNLYGNPAAFDIMTGIVKEFRGQGYANEMFNVIKAKMKDKAIENFYLEVLQENKPAIKSYSKSGFIKTRGLNCYSLKKHQHKPFKTIQTMVVVDRLANYDLDRLTCFLDWEPSWENHYESIKRCIHDVEIIEAKHFGKSVGMLVYHPSLRWILCLAVDPELRRKGIATTLLEYLMYELPAEVDEIKALNIDEKDKGMNRFLINTGFELITSQFEMLFKMN